MELKIALSTRLWVSSTSWNYIKHLVPATSNTSNNKALSPWSSSLPGVASTRRVTEKMGQCLVMTYELVCNEVLRNITETSQGSWDTILTPRSIQESGWFSGIQTRTLGRTPDKFNLRGNEGRESSDDRGVNHIHHTSINPHTAIIGFLTTFKRTQIIQTKCGGEWHENLDTQHEGLDGARH